MVGSTFSPEFGKEVNTLHAKIDFQ